MTHTWRPVICWLALTSCGGVGGGDAGAPLDTGAPPDGTLDATVDAPLGPCGAPRELECVDAMILDLELHDDLVSEGVVANGASGGDWTTTVDASAGGFGSATNYPWSYVRFEDDGAVRVDIDDESALESMDWHVAARRYVIRLNGGSSGPSCVSAAAFPALAYEAIDAEPAGARYQEDDFYDEGCVLIDDGSGLPGSPRTALGGWWSYKGCVATEPTPFVVRLPEGRLLKLHVEAYYATGQEECNASGVPGTGGGVYTWRWRFLD